MENLTEALSLMGIGLTTVMLVLLLIIGVGKLLIYLVSKYIPEEQPAAVVAPKSNNAVDTNVANAINLAISKLTNGKMKAEKIERI